MPVPCFASYQNLCWVHNATCQTCGMNGTQCRTQLDNICPNKRFWQQSSMLSGQWSIMLTYKHTHTQKSHLHVTKRLKHADQKEFKKQTQIFLRMILHLSIILPAVAELSLSFFSVTTIIIAQQTKIIKVITST